MFVWSEAIFFSVKLATSSYICFGRSKEPSHQDSSFDHPQHTFWLIYKKINVQLRTPGGKIYTCPLLITCEIYKGRVILTKALVL